MTITSKPQLVKLSGAVQHYDWGGKTYIPQLTGTENGADQPFAELWMGDHAGAPATVLLPEATMPLNRLFEMAPDWLGKKMTATFGNRLPYLFKILDVRSMLSIQVHPDKAAAVEGFRQENEAGIPLNAPNRNFKDDNHKPEIMVALSDFWLLHGFRSEEETGHILTSISELNFLYPTWKAEGIKFIYRYLMEMSQDETDVFLAPLAERLAADIPEDKNHPDFWAWRAIQTFRPTTGRYDRGIFSIYLFNLVHLKPGEGIYQGAGIPHAYLEGVNAELMSNSDNVFRGGLTTKHIDVPLLLRHLHFDPVKPKAITGTSRSETEIVYPTPAPDFELSCIRLEKDQVYTSESVCGPHILIILEGAVLVNNTQPFRRGECFLVPEGLKYEITGQAVLYKAGLPI